MSDSHLTLARTITPVLEDLQLWLALQRETTERVHSSWFPNVSADLVVRARRSPLGRRWLANRLALVSPLLFGIPYETEALPARNLSNAQWLRACLHEASECALDLGSLTLAVTVRTMVTRSEVVRLRAVLGAERYERLLSVSTATSPGRPLVALGIGARAEADCRGDDLLERLLQRGARELATYAFTLHPALGESVRLSFECNWWDVESAPLLAPAVIESCLRQRDEQQKDAARVGTEAPDEN
jgi:hypothetical protein